MGQRADLPTDIQRPGRNIDAIDAGLAAVGLYDGAKHAQRGRFARAVRSDQPRDTTIVRAEAHIVHGDDVAEVLGQALGLDHGEGPMGEVKIGNP